MPSVLFVDDEKQILKSIRRLLIDKNYDIYTAESGEEALTILNETPINLIISDMRMPGMDGYQLLRLIKEKKPSTIRIILSGYADESLIYKAIQDGSANMYLLKPWENTKLEMLIDNLLQISVVLEDKNLLKIFGSIHKLPTIPMLYNRLCTLIDRDSNLDAIVNLLEEDQSISAKVLQMANATFYSKSIGSIKVAIQYLGLINLRNIVLTTSVFSNLNAGRNNLYMDKKLLWKHSGLSNQIVLLLHERILKKRIPESYITAGLLHDIGKVVLIDYLPNEYLKVTEYMKMNKQSSLHDVENELLNISHQEAGGYLLNLWGLPLPIIEAALYHHDPLNKSIINFDIVGLVHIANYYSWKVIGIDMSEKLCPEVFERFHTSQEECDMLVKDYIKIDN
ncbi:MAG: HDOD domain-containing protein [Bacillota bacterium]